MATKSVQEMVNELWDREAIRSLPQRYCDCVWRGDVACLVGLFTEEGVFASTGGEREQVSAGRAKLLEAYANIPTSKPRPYIHNHVIELKDHGHASGRCY